MSSTAIMLSDIHLDVEFKRGLAAAKEAIAYNGPQCVVLAGDIVNFGSLSLKYEKAKGETIRVSEQIDQAIELAHFCRSHADRVVFIPGNHENRWERLLKHEKADALEGVVGLRLEDQFRRQGLGEDIEWVEESADEGGCRGLWLGNRRGRPLLIRHGHMTPASGSDGRAKARKLITKEPRINQAVGHWHTAGIEWHTDMYGRSYFALTNGHLSNDKSFAPGADWQRGLAQFTFDADTIEASMRVAPYLAVMDNRGVFQLNGKTFGR